MSIANISATTTFVHEPFEGRNTTQQFCDNLMQQPRGRRSDFVWFRHKLQCMIVPMVSERWCYDPCRIFFLPPAFLCCSSRLSKSFCSNESHDDQRGALSHYTAENLLGVCSVCADVRGIIVICPICPGHTGVHWGRHEGLCCWSAGSWSARRMRKDTLRRFQRAVQGSPREDRCSARSLRGGYPEALY